MSRSPQELRKKMALKNITERGEHNKKLGVKGEKKARRFLFFRGWKILAKNYKNPFGEIDIIARKGDTIAFIEVKTRLSDVFGIPSEAVDKAKKLRYIRGANYFLINRNIDLNVRFDIIEVFRGQINHIENAFIC